ncbi:MAG: hypothetical protein ACHQAQ_20855 [Hyphomicrobiales bacterium]
MTEVTPKRRRDWRPTFLSTFAGTGIVRVACHAAGISRTQAYRERGHNQRFAQAWDQADEDATEALEAEARRRAMSTSDVLLMFLLKGRKPAVYRDNARLELTGAAGGPIQTQVFAGFDDHEKAALRRLLDEALAEEKE